MTKLSIIEELKARYESGLFTISVRLGAVIYVCFHEATSLYIYRVEGNLITYHAKEISPDLDCDVVESLCLHIEEQHAADKPTQGKGSD